MPKQKFKTGNVGVEFIDDAQVANHDTEVLPKMVNANIDKKKRNETFATSSR